MSIDFSHQQQQQQQQGFYTLEEDYDLMEQEQAYFAEYDRAIATEAFQADYADACNFEDQQEEQLDDDDIAMDYVQEQQGDIDDVESKPLPSYDYEQDSLLHLIVGVQSYLTDMSSAGIDRKDSPLVELQYKMYTYLKQRACEMGLDTEGMSP